MFKFLKKLIKWTVIISVVIVAALFALGVYIDKNMTPEERVAMEQVRAEHDAAREAERIARMQEESAAEDARLRQLAEENMAKAAAEQRSRLESQLTTYCMDQIKNSALYPTKVDFHVFKTDRRVFENFSTGDKPNRFMFNTGGEMMNGFGNMVPFTAVCKVDFNNREFTLVEVLVN